MTSQEFYGWIITGIIAFFGVGGFVVYKRVTGGSKNTMKNINAGGDVVGRDKKN